jgi:hypothetical protein
MVRSERAGTFTFLGSVQADFSLLATQTWNPFARSVFPEYQCGECWGSGEDCECWGHGPRNPVYEKNCSTWKPRILRLQAMVA